MKNSRKELTMQYGYIRVSTREQNEERQLIAMREQEIPDGNLFIDKQSGRDFERPAYRQLLERLQQGDVLYVTSIDRLGRNYEEILEQWRVLTKEIAAEIVVLDMPLLDTRRGSDLIGTFISDIVLQLLSFVAENERTNIRRRQAEGIAAAKARGVKFGRPQTELPEEFPQIILLWKNGEITRAQAIEMAGCSESTFYRRIRASEGGAERRLSFCDSGILKSFV